MHTTPSTITLTALAAAVLTPDVAAAGTIFAQTPPSDVAALTSDRNGDAVNPFQQIADEFTLITAATARSVTWRGAFATNNPQGPVSFDLIFYGDTGLNAPDETDVRGNTTVEFASTSDFTDTGIDVVDPPTAGVFDVYEFSADLDPVALPAGEQVWFSVLADTSADADESFFWTFDNSDAPLAFRQESDADAPFTSGNFGEVYFILGSTPVPEPAGALGGTALIATVALRRRRIDVA